MVDAPPFAYLHHPPGPMATGFFGYHAAGRKIRAKGDAARHSCNSLPTTRPKPTTALRLFGNTYGKIGHLNCWSKAMMELAALVRCSRGSFSDSEPTLSDLFNVW